MAALKQGKGFCGEPVMAILYDLAFRVEVAPADTNYIQYAGFRCAADQVR